MKWIKAFFGIGILLLALAVSIVSWRDAAERGLYWAARYYGYPDITFTLESFSNRHATFRDISFSPDVPITFDRVVLTFTPEELQDARLTIAEASARWSGGTLKTHNAELSWNRPELLVAHIEVNAVPLDALMQIFSGGYASASGVVSGTLPVTVTQDHTLLVRDGMIRAGSAGVLKVAPEAIPADNEHVGMVREALKNFHYTRFQMELDSDPDKKISMLLQLHGNNPDAYNGREIKLNIHLQGDLLSVAQQSILPMLNPTQLLKDAP